MEMNSTILDISGKYYTLTDTLASDGNCLYHALALTLHVSHKQLRSKTMEAILKMYHEGNKLVVQIYDNWAPQSSHSYPVPLDEFIMTKMSNGSWGSNLDMFYVCMVYGVNIVCISNLNKGLSTFDVYTWLRKMEGGMDYISEFVADDADTCYLYHFIKGEPFEPPEYNADHFGSLSLLNVYTGGATKTIPSMETVIID